MQYALYVKRWNHFLVDSTDVGIHVISELPGDVLFTTFDNRWPKCACFSLDNDHAVAVQLCPDHS